jgi:hypothetical protein
MTGVGRTRPGRREGRCPSLVDALREVHVPSAEEPQGMNPGNAVTAFSFWHRMPAAERHRASVHAR